MAQKIPRTNELLYRGNGEDTPVHTESSGIISLKERERERDRNGRSAPRPIGRSEGVNKGLNNLKPRLKKILASVGRMKIAFHPDTGVERLRGFEFKKFESRRDPCAFRIRRA